ncbi:FAD-dependent oxidoreductase [Saccharopolyspora erythraea]|uniref:NAD(P)/FAD-dependent oxidoreductase n=1 Tax=Saccharopolyspora erythraea TaxID=1836 RepID=UPI001BA86A07|nr:FAD/NAD(P)-binding oxidoreductase [Saccharopolyspora erythraea]QUH00675.1 FAD-dependent oxidoreductase [Saccharopolyspora erythraea]
MRTVVVVGAALAGWRAAQELREQGFTGRLVLVGAEERRPYDRQPLSKEFLTGNLDSGELALDGADEEAALDAEWRLGVPAIGLDSRSAEVVLADGSRIHTDGVVLATGAERATLPGAAAHRLHTLDDAIALKADIRAGARVVVVGGGLVGSEVAASCRSLGAQVTVVDAQHLPMARTFGIEIAPLCAALHEDHGVRLRFGTPATRVLGEDRVTGVELADGRVIPAEAVVTDVGSRPAAEWLRGSGVRLRDGVLTDSGCVTRVPNVVAVGDVARYQSVHRNHTVRGGHWSTAANQPPVAVRNLLAGRTVEHYSGVPHLWSRQHGSTFQFAGYAGPKDRIDVVDGSPAARRFVATYQRGGRMVAVFAMNSPRQFAVHRRRLTAALTPALAKG